VFYYSYELFPEKDGFLVHFKVEIFEGEYSESACNKFSLSEDIADEQNGILGE